ncbi:hypothetical protein [Streptomyces sp. NPDC046261]|uniref:hypothetical protein n=1 Tax=Streptomyces sp. NPDC046261 TaxID=3157200 RepID=UPI00340DCBC1
MIEPGKIPTFTGNLPQLETDASGLKKTAGSIRGTGKAVHDAFQGLSTCYEAPESGPLLESTTAVRDKADAFAKKLESVGGALQGFATAAEPLVKKMNQLRKDAEAFVRENKDDDDWQQDQKKVDENERIVREVGTTWVAFQGVERDAANKITALVGGTHFVVDDGSHKAGMYGFRESDVKDATETPWGTVDEREYTGLRAAWEWTKDNVGGALKGFFVDGLWGTLKGLGSMINIFDWDNFKKTWSGIGDVFGGVSAYIATPYEWAMDKMFGPTDHSDTDRQKAALRNFGKSLVAWDEWGKNPSRAFGTVLFNGLTLGSGSLLKLGKAGKVGAGAEALTALGKAGAFVDPASYLGKAAGVTKLKVGELFDSFKNSRAGLDDLSRNLPPTKPGDMAFDPSGNLKYVDQDGKAGTLTNDGKVLDHNGDPVKTPHREQGKADLDSPVTVPDKQKAGATVGGGGSHTPSGGSGGSGGGHGETPGTGAGAGDNGGKGSGSGAGDDAGKGSGAGDNGGKGSGTGDNGGKGSGTGDDAGKGSGTGDNGGKGSGTGDDAGKGSGTGDDAGKGSGTGDNGGKGSGTGDNGGKGSGTGDDAGKGSGTGDNGGKGSGTGDDASKGSGTGDDAGKGPGDDAGKGSGDDAGSGDGGGTGGDSGAGDGSGGDHTPPGTYKPGPDGEVPNLKRHDADFSDTHNSKGQRKSYLNADGDLVPANPHGDATIVDHIVGREPKKSESPYTSTSEDGANAKDYGGQKIQIDLPRLVDDIAKGKVKGVEVYSPKEVEAAIQQAADKVAGKHVDISVPPNTSYADIDAKAAQIAKDLGLGKAKTKSLAQRMKDMMHTRRDSEWLIKGVVPRDYISGP